jgi:hypothetical protein
VKGMVGAGIRHAERAGIVMSPGGGEVRRACAVLMSVKSMLAILTINLMDFPPVGVIFC